ncbi:CdaR family protein [Paenibacillus senegalensis]|uniref:CdaR family protein n=1 Tax=Paenibacillus senegalensis TaxID=1465766 RepID=UPI000288F5FF|nr:CdaR family protein [Paenibacillus senegalensis]
MMDKWLRNDNVVKVVALAMGILLWVVVHNTEVQNSAGIINSATGDLRYNNVKVEPEYDTETYTVSVIEPSEVAVILRGRQSDLKQVQASIRSFKIKADLTKYESGTYTAFLHSSGLPDNVTAEIIPQAVRVVIEEKQMKEVDVVIEPTGTPAEGFRVGKPIVTPGRVYVTVPESRLDEVAMARAEVNVDGASSTVSKQVTLTVIDQNGNPMEDLEVSPQVVDVEVPVTSPFKQMPLQMRVTGQPAAGFSVAAVKLSSEQVTVFAPQNVLDNLEFLEGPPIDLSGIRETTTLTIPLEPTGDLIDINPTEVEVTVEIARSQTKSFMGHSIEIIGQDDSLSAGIVEPDGGTVDIILEGAPSLLNQVNAEDLQAVIDISNLPPGRYELPIKLNLPLYIRKASGPELKATVEIEAPGSGAP